MKKKRTDAEILLYNDYTRNCVGENQGQLLSSHVGQGMFVEQPG